MEKPQDDHKKSTSHHHNKQHHKKNVDEHVKKFEDKLDQAAQRIEKKLEKNVSPETKKHLTEVAHSADTFVDGVEGVVESLDDIARSVAEDNVGSQAAFAAVYQEDVSRLFIFRFLWLLIEYRILIVWAFFISILMIIHRIYMLIFWKRSHNLRKREVRFRRHIIKRKAYLSGLTDRRPDFIEK